MIFKTAAKTSNVKYFDSTYKPLPVGHSQKNLRGFYTRRYREHSHVKVLGVPRFELVHEGVKVKLNPVDLNESS